MPMNGEKNQKQKLIFVFWYESTIYEKNKSHFNIMPPPQYGGSTA